MLPPGLPETAAGRHLAWLLDMLVHGGATDRAALEAHFDRAFLDKRPIEQTAAALVQLAGHLIGAQFRSVTATDADHLVVHGSVAANRFALTLGIAPSSQRIAVLNVAADTGPRPTSMADAIQRLRALAPRTQLLAAELDGTTCRPLQRWHAEEPLAIASMFKLYVLLGLADRILAGHAAWTDELTIRADWASLPAHRDDVPGTKISLRALADRMISISDNTAADYLLYTVGRTNVEASMRAAHHAHPALNTPFLGTRELFWIKTALSADEVAGYTKLAEQPRRRFLDQLAGKHPITDFSDWTTPRYIDRVEWFASADDLCHLVATLRSRAQTPAAAPLLAVMAINPGISNTRGWSYIGFKGGSEPGVIGGTWLLQRDDGRWFVVTLGANAPTAPDGRGLNPAGSAAGGQRGSIDESAFLGVSEGIIDLVATGATR